MITINPYLNFKGNCEEAFNFYKCVFGGEFSFLGRFKDMPGDPKCPISESDKKKIMHISLLISKETVLMGCDIPEFMREKFVRGTDFSISIQAKSKDEAKRIFIDLSDGGVEVMPMKKTFWNSYFGMCKDKYGISWMIDCPLDE